MKRLVLLLAIFFQIFAFRSFAYQTPVQHLDQLDFTIAFGSINGSKAYGYFELKLKDEWKAYSNDSLNVGLPITVQIHSKQVHNFQISWPVPHTFHDATGIEVTGYGGDIKIPFSYDVKSHGANIEMYMKGKYAVCNLLCVFHEFNETIILEPNHLDVTVDTLIKSALKDVPKKEDIQHLREQIINSTEISEEMPSSGITTVLYMMLLAFLGGIILNVMPCVLPVVSLKFAQISNGKSKLSRNLQMLFTVLGILLSFAVLSCIVILLKFFGLAVGWGFHFQQPIFVLVMMAILIAFTFSQIGLFDVSIKGFDRIGNVFNKLSPDRPSYHFFYGLVITLLATPCTAPMLGSAVGFALSQPFWVIFPVFLSIGIGLALPYIVLIIIPLSPKLILPKPGVWLNYIKYIAASLLYGSALWLLFVLFAQVGFIFACVLFCLVNILVFLSVRSNFKNIWRILLLIIIFSPLLVSYSGFTSKNIRNQSLVWNKFDELQIQEQIAAGKVVFVDITAEWCLTCKFNKIHVLSDSEVQRVLSQENIYLMLGDMTQPNEELLNFIKKHNRAGIPFNAIVKNGEFIILSEILNKEVLIDKISQKN